MSADLQAWPLRIFIGGQDWSDWATLTSIGWSSYDRGIARKSASLTISRSPDNPESIDPRTNRARWREGQVVTGQIKNAAGNWIPHPLLPLVILSNPRPPGRSRSSIELELGCRLSYLESIPAPDEDKSEVLVNQPVNYSEICRRYLIAGQVQASEIALTADWGYSLDYPHQKTGGGSWIQEAADLAEICGRVLYCNKFGQIVDRPLSLTSLPAFEITAGEDDEEFDDEQELAAPPATVTVTATGKAPSGSTTGGTSGLPERICTYGPLTDLVPGLVGYGEVVCQRRYPVVIDNFPDGSFRERTRVEELQRGGVISPRMTPPLSQMRTARDVTEDRYYDSQKRLYKEVILTEQPAIAVDPEETANKTMMVITSRKTTTYGFGSGNEIIAQDIRDEASKRAIYDQETGSARWEIKTRSFETYDWFKGSDGHWYARHSLARAFAEIKPESTTTDNAYQPVGDPRAAITERSDPPRIQTYGSDGANAGYEDKQFKGVAEFENPGGSTNRNFPKNLNLSAPAVSDAQCAGVARITGALLWGRNQGFSVRLGLEKLLNIDYPLPRIDAIEPPIYDWLANPQPPNKRHKMLLDALTIEASASRANVAGYGIWLGTDNSPPYRVPTTIEFGYTPVGLDFVIEPEEDAPVFSSIAQPTSSCSSRNEDGGIRSSQWVSPTAPGTYTLRVSIAYGSTIVLAQYTASAPGTGYVAGNTIHYRQIADGTTQWFNRSTNSILTNQPPASALGTPRIMHVVRWRNEPHSGNFNDSYNCEWAAEVKDGKTRITADSDWRFFGIRTVNPSNSNYFDGVYFTISSAPNQSFGDAQQLVLRGF